MIHFKRISIILIAIGFIYLLIVAAFMFSGTRAKPSDNADTVLILGAKVNGSGRTGRSIKRKVRCCCYLFKRKSDDASSS